MADVPVHAAPSSEFSATTGADATELAAEFEKAKPRIAELESVETIPVRRHEELLDEIKQLHVEEIRLWKEIFAENADSLNNEVKLRKQMKS